MLARAPPRSGSIRSRRGRLGRRRTRGRRRRAASSAADVQGAGRASCRSTGGPIAGRFDDQRRRRRRGFGTHIVDVEVDPETGKVTVLRYTAVQDAGKAVHPSYVEGQMQGGAVQGIGWALNEEYVYDADGPDAERQLPRLPHADVASTCR